MKVALAVVAAVLFASATNATFLSGHVWYEVDHASASACREDEKRVLLHTQSVHRSETDCPTQAIFGDLSIAAIPTISVASTNGTTACVGAHSICVSTKHSYQLHASGCCRGEGLANVAAGSSWQVPFTVDVRDNEFSAYVAASHAIEVVRSSTSDISHFRVPFVVDQERATATVVCAKDRAGHCLDATMNIASKIEHVGSGLFAWNTAGLKEDTRYAVAIQLGRLAVFDTVLHLRTASLETPFLVTPADHMSRVNSCIESNEPVHIDVAGRTFSKKSSVDVKLVSQLPAGATFDGARLSFSPVARNTFVAVQSIEKNSAVSGPIHIVHVRRAAPVADDMAPAASDAELSRHARSTFTVKLSETAPSTDLAEGDSYNVQASTDPVSEYDSLQSFTYQVANLDDTNWLDVSATNLISEGLVNIQDIPFLRVNALTIGNIVSSYRRIKFRVRAVGSDSTEVFSREIIFDFDAGEYILLQNTEIENLAFGKQVFNYWSYPSEGNFQDQAVSMFRVVSTEPERRDYLAGLISDASSTQIQLDALDVAGVDTYWTVNNQYVRITFATSLIFNAATFESQILAIVKSALLAHGGLSNVAVKIISTTITGQQNPQNVIVTARDVISGAIVDSSVIISSLSSAGAASGTCGVFSSMTDSSNFCPMTSTPVNPGFTTIQASIKAFLTHDVTTSTVKYLGGGRIATSDESALWNIKQTTVADPATEDLPFVASDRVKICMQSNSTRCLKAFFNTATSTWSFSIANDADATVFAHSTNREFWLTDANLNVAGSASDLNEWASLRCGPTNAAQNAENVLECTNLDLRPTYRRLELDLLGEFGISTLTVRLGNYPLPVPSGTGPFQNPLASFLPNRQADSSPYISRLELWVRNNESEPWIDLTGSENQYDANGGAVFTKGTTCVSAFNREACDIEFLVEGFTREVLDKRANFGWRYISVRFAQMNSFGDVRNRYYSVRELRVTGYCICNGHSRTCDTNTGFCFVEDSGNKDIVQDCGHFTTGTSCQFCQPGYRAEIQNDAPTSSFNCDSEDLDHQCDGPLLPEITPVEIEAGSYTYNGQSGAIGATRPDQFQVFFPPTGPCVPCACNTHSIFDLCTDSDKRNCPEGCAFDTGECNCDTSTNTEGFSCETCIDGFCRASCNATEGHLAYEVCREEVCTACDCNLHAVVKTSSGADTCDKDFCGCHCKADDHAVGPHCEFCENGYWSNKGNSEDGTNCQQCMCNGHKKYTNTDNVDECNATGGHCMFDYNGNTQECDGNTMGANCELCKPGYFRPVDSNGNVDLTDDCSPCACNQHGLATTYPSHGWTVGTTAVCNPDGGICNCDPSDHVMGDNCEACQVGYWNNEAGGARNGAVCLVCQCYGHKSYAFNECAVLGGSCELDYDGNAQPCNDHTDGQNCGGCDAGYYRPFVGGGTIDRAQNCTECNCNGHATSTVTTGEEFCTADGGECACTGTSNSEGFNCESCKANTWSTQGDAQNGVDCAPCACYGHSSTCNNFGVCSGCADNTENGGDGRCEKCIASNYRQNHDLYTNADPDGATPDAAQVEAIKFEDCSPCQCNGHSKADPNTDDGICDPFTAVCHQCGDWTANGPLGQCEVCQSNYFRHMTGVYDASADTCRACDLADGTNCQLDTVTSSCRPCEQQCFGTGNNECTMDTGVCTNCPANTHGSRCELCDAGFYGSPANGIPCVPCKCNHYVDAGTGTVPNAYNSFEANFPNAIDAYLKCAFDNGIAQPTRCILDESLLNPTTIAQLQGSADHSAFIRCNCPRHDPTSMQGYSGIAYDESDRQCAACNNMAYFGRPAVCSDDSGNDALIADGSSAVGCEGNDFYPCIACVCNNNIDPTSSQNNCAAKQDSGALTCTNCLGHTTGMECDVCEDGYYGMPTNQAVSGSLNGNTFTGFVLDSNGDSLKCWKCDCNGRATDRLTGVSDIAGDMCTTTSINTFTCSCDASLGYTGEHCLECLRGWEKVEDTHPDSTPDNYITSAGRVYCRPCDKCVRDVIERDIVPLEASMGRALAGIAQLNSTISSGNFGSGGGGVTPAQLAVAVADLRSEADTESDRVDLAISTASNNILTAIAAEANPIKADVDVLKTAVANHSAAISQLQSSLSAFMTSSAANLNAQIASSNSALAALTASLNNNSVAIQAADSRITSVETALTTANSNTQSQLDAYVTSNNDALNTLSNSQTTLANQASDNYDVLVAEILSLKYPNLVPAGGLNLIPLATASGNAVLACGRLAGQDTAISLSGASGSYFDIAMPDLATNLPNFGSSGFTMTAHFNTVGTTGYIVSQGLAGSSTTRYWGIYIDLNRPAVFIYLRAGGANLRYIIPVSTAPTQNTWHHIAVSVDVALNKAVVMLDGSVVGSMDITSLPLFIKNDAPIRMGARLDGSFRFNGLIEDVRIYDRAFTPAQVAAATSMTVTGICV